MLVTVLIVFGVGFVSGAVIGRGDSILLNGAIGGAIGAVLFVLVTSVMALIMTVIQSIRKSNPASFGRRFMWNLDAAMEFLVHGWS